MASVLAKARGMLRHYVHGAVARSEDETDLCCTACKTLYEMKPIRGRDARRRGMTRIAVP